MAMSIDIEQIKRIIHDLFSKDGYKVNNFGVSCPNDLGMNIKKQDDCIDIMFTSNLPTVFLEKFIKFNVALQGISLGLTKGYIRLKNFPDIPISYTKKSQEIIATSNHPNLDDIYADIDAEYQDEGRKKIAQKCLQYASEWTTIVCSNGVDLKDAKPVERRKLKKQCCQFVKENIQNEKDNYGFAILGTILLFYLLPILINWVVTKLLNKWWSD
jgi:isocitrate dehydrogenase